MPSTPINVAVIGGGAAGYFAAIRCAELYPMAEVVIYEKTEKLLAKVKVSGGGRCNVTNGAPYASQVVKAYPRGRSLLKKLFKRFDHQDAWAWFTRRGVSLKTEADGRVFPVSNKSQDIIYALMTAAEAGGVEVRTGCQVQGLKPVDNGWLLKLKRGEEIKHSHVIIATGGSNKLSSYQWLADLGHTIVPPVPSLFTFNMPEEDIKSRCQGVVVQQVKCHIEGMKFNSIGSLLVTHWGMSGPAILKLSSWAARALSQVDYQFRVQICWLPSWSEASLKAHFMSEETKMKNHRISELPKRHYLYLLDRAEVDGSRAWSELDRRSKNKLLHTLLHDSYQVDGKTTFKEEFVTCGGVSLADIDHKTLESRVVPGLYFAGEVLDIDAVTGGYNFQAAWTTGYVAGELGDSN